MLPPVLVAVRTHRVLKARADAQRAMSALRMAERSAKADGLSLRALRETMTMLMKGPEWVERQQRDLLTIMSAIQCAVQVETSPALEVTTDVSPAERRKDIFRQGYTTSVQCGARQPYGYDDSDDQAAWLEGFDAFAADLAAFEQTETQKRTRPAKAA